jgi:L,D-peptidoglycan transpeptidase YkuD (ErfK/YbiS/YcfS/YnhG family)
MPYCVSLTQKELNNFMHIKKFFTFIRMICIIPMLLSVTACFLVPAAHKFDAPMFLAAQKNNIGASTQIILTVDNSSFFFNKTTLYAMEKRSDNWQTALEPFDAVIGRNGFATPGEKREGDGKTPSGIYPLAMTFGYDAAAGTKMPYRQSLDDDIWVDDASADDYNRWTKKQETHAASFEIMRRDDNLYKYGIVINYNTDPVIKGNGSAIFLHIWKDESSPTAGCVAVAEENIIKLLGWLDPAASPLIITGIKN